MTYENHKNLKKIDRPLLRGLHKISEGLFEASIYVSIGVLWALNGHKEIGIAFGLLYIVSLLLGYVVFRKDE